MEAFYLVKNAKPLNAFELRPLTLPALNPDEVKIKADAFGLNFADVMARNGLYHDCPPLPAVIGYEVVGHIEEMGSDVTGLNVGQRVVGFCRFGGYATHVITKAMGVAPIPDDMDSGEAAALATQYCTAYYAAEEMTRLNEGDHVLIQAAAGGVGTALIQLARHRKCVIYGAAGSDEKLEYLKQQGVDYPINYRKADFYESVKEIMKDEGPDVIFNSLGGSTVRSGLKLLGSGGRIVCYGAAETAGDGKIMSGLKQAWGFGLLFTPVLLMQSKSIIGVNMLPISDNKQRVLNRCLTKVVSMTEQGILKPTVGGVFKAEQLAEAHDFLESRKSIGKIIVEW